MPGNNKKNQNQTVTRDPKGRFVSTGKSISGGGDVFDSSTQNTVSTQNDAGQLPSTTTVTPASQIGFGKETQPNYEDIYLQEAERTKEIKDQIAELEKGADVEAKEIRGEIELPQIVKDAGVEKIGEDTPLSETPQIELPMDDTKIFKSYKQIKNLHQDISSSVNWLAVWCIRQLAMLHIKLKEVHGKIVRQTG